MAKDKQARRKARVKAKKKEREKASTAALRREKADFFLYEAMWFEECMEYEKALGKVEKALRSAPNDPDILLALGRIANKAGKSDLETHACRQLYRTGNLPQDFTANLCWGLVLQGRTQEALETAEETLRAIAGRRKKGIAALRKTLVAVRNHCVAVIENAATAGEVLRTIEKSKIPPSAKNRLAEPAASKAAAVPSVAGDNRSNKPAPIAAVPVSVSVDTEAFAAVLSGGHFKDPDAYALALEAQQIRFRESYDQLICLPFLKNVRSLPYQEETARKVLKDFRGRALLADEVGLGKTIEAGIIIKEYIQRGMIQSALILTPTPLVSQWKDELQSKFGLAFPSTDDPDFRTGKNGFWKSPFLLASINIAKSKKHFDTVTKREYDLVVVDEAHHLKNRSTLNWKLVNALKKRFLLLLSATPVENNLMELYNLITLLKPGQLKTATEFRSEFMTQGDPTDPRNRARLKDLLGQVMIRNTRAVARINLPPRFAYTVQVQPSPHEQELYDRVTQLVQQINADSGSRRKLVLKNLLATAGSSPPAVAKTVQRLLLSPDLSDSGHRQARAIVNLTRSMADTRKNDMLEKLIRSMPGKTIVFVKYVATLEHLSDFFTWRNIGHCLFHGAMDNAEKDRQILVFREEKDVLLTTEIGGEGRNLQFCHQMINYDLPWNPMKIEQRIGRIHRIGQEKEVVVHNLCAVGSAEEYILDILDKKINMFELVIGEIDMILGRIRGEREFSEMVYDIWVQSVSAEERRKGFGRLADQLVRSKNGYLKTRELDEKLFGETYEL
jgi:superfamily II DNA or RNA helicase